MQDSSAVTTILFTDIEGSTRLWESEPERMRPALAAHDALARASVVDRRGIVVKMTGDGIHAAFENALDAIGAAIALQHAVADPSSTGGVRFNIRCGLHAGIVERRDNDFFGNAVNRAARIMTAAHGGQILLSHRVAELVGAQLPTELSMRDLGWARLRDLSKPERIYQLVHPQLRADFPPLRSLEATPNNLPQNVTSFIGRDAALRDVRTLLGQHRLLTLVGTGGLGKTRISLQVAAEAMDDFADGVWFVELAAVADAALVPEVVASTLGVKETAGQPILDALVRYMADLRVLIVLDNCEHLTDACADIAWRLIQAGPHVKVLASSREHLHVTGEAVYPLPPLSLPDIGTFDVVTLMQCEAVRLFVERATAAQPNFRLTPDNAPAVVDICRRLDGIPLALELAAARVRPLSVPNIAARLHDRFRLLSSGDRTVLPRQRTLRALIDWSHDLLDDDERKLFRRLAVFAGGWTLDAVERVAPDDDLAPADAVDFLTRLVDKSLVTLDADGDRYRMIETIRQYAQERLDESNERDRTRTRHLMFYLDLAERARVGLMSADQAAWLAQLDAERENILSAHAYCDNAEQGAELGFRLSHSVKQYWLNRGLASVGHRVIVESLARPGADARNLGRCRALFNAGQISCFMGRYGEAVASLEESLAIARELDDKGRVAASLQLLGMAALGLGELDVAHRYLNEGLDLARAQGDRRELAAAMNAVAQLHRVQGALDTAEPLYQDVIALARELGDREIVAIGLLNLAMVDVHRTAFAAARRKLVEVVEIARELGSKPAGQSVLEVSAGLAASMRAWERAARLYGAANAQAARTGLQRDPADEAFLRPWIEQARRALGPQLFSDLEALGRKLPYDDAMTDVDAWLRADKSRAA